MDELPRLTEAVSQYIKLTLWKGGEAVGWKRFRAVTYRGWDSGVPNV
jgi:hypothetical protein